MMPQAHGHTKQTVSVPAACRAAYGESMVFVHATGSERKRPFSVDDQLAFEQS